MYWSELAAEMVNMRIQALMMWGRTLMWAAWMATT
jgi:hypothetical protein